MKEHDLSGAIVNVSSVGAYIPFPGHSLYSLTKAAVDSITRSIAVELAEHKVCRGVQYKIMINLYS